MVKMGLFQYVTQVYKKRQKFPEGGNRVPKEHWMPDKRTLVIRMKYD